MNLMICDHLVSSHSITLLRMNGDLCPFEQCLPRLILSTCFKFLSRICIHSWDTETAIKAPASHKWFKISVLISLGRLSKEGSLGTYFSKEITSSSCSLMLMRELSFLISASRKNLSISSNLSITFSHSLIAIFTAFCLHSYLLRNYLILVWYLLSRGSLPSV